MSQERAALVKIWAKASILHAALSDKTGGFTSPFETAQELAAEIYALADEAMAESAVAESDAP